MPNPLYDTLLQPHANSSALFIDRLDGGNQIEYAEFINRAAQVANALVAAGVAPGDRLVAQVGKSVSSLSLYAGCLQAGIVYLPLNTAYTPSEVEYFVQDSEARMLVCDPDKADSLSNVAHKYNVQLLTQSNDGQTGSLIDRVDKSGTEFETVSRSVDDLQHFCTPLARQVGPKARC